MSATDVLCDEHAFLPMLLFDNQLLSLSSISSVQFQIAVGSRRHFVLMHLIGPIWGRM
jgi:hypothetical protein